MRNYFDLTLKKSFAPFKDKNLKFEARIDAINVLNHPNFGWASIGSGTGFTSGRGPGTPNMANISLAEFNAWATFNGQAAAANTSDARIVGMNNMLNPFRLGTALLQPNFFSIAVPTGFLQKNLNSFDITTLEGFKLYRLRQTWNQSFGQLSTNLDQPRKVQWALKFIF